MHDASLFSRLSAEIMPLHKRLEQCACFKGLMQNPIDQNHYTNALKCLWHFHASYEFHAGAFLKGDLIWQTPSALIKTDLKQVNAGVFAQMANPRNKKPSKCQLLAYLYVYFGSMLGAKMITPRLIKFALPHGYFGQSLWLGGAERFEAIKRIILNEMNQHGMSEAAFIAGVKAQFQGLIAYASGDALKDEQALKKEPA